MVADHQAKQAKVGPFTQFRIFFIKADFKIIMFLCFSETQEAASTRQQKRKEIQRIQVLMRNCFAVVHFLLLIHFAKEHCKLS